MIRKSRFAIDSETFASERRTALADIEERISRAAKTSLVRVGLPDWYGLLLNAMLDVFDIAVLEETSEISPIITDLRNEFKREVAESLSKAKRSDNPAAQEEAIIRWAATASVNAAVEAATAADPDENVGVEWVTMGDENVRASHREMHGAQVPTGQTFEIEGTEVAYPGQPVGDPGIFMNCRCVLRPAMLGGDGFASEPETFANASDPSEQGADPTAVIVALSREGDPITSLASGDHPHTTLVYLGSAGPEGVLPEMEEVVKLIPTLMTDKVSGRGTLGKDEADVLLLDANATSIIRKALMDMPVIEQLFKEADDQFPHWIPHTTIGYPDAPAQGEEVPEDITYDRIAYWRGEEMHEMKFSLEEPESITASGEEKPVFHPEDPEVEGLQVWRGVLAPEGTPSGDGRQFSINALTNRELPLPLKAMPADASGHDGSIIVGRIDRIWREGNLVMGEGVFDNSPYAEEVKRQMRRKMLRGVSVDVDAVTVQELAQTDPDANPIAEVTSARICAVTLCAVPAFAEAFIVLVGEEPSGDVEAPEEYSASEPLSIVASAHKVLSADYFRNPGLEAPTPVTITDDGHLFGHVAAWGVCHIAFRDSCTTAPSSKTNYAYYRTGEVITDAGPVAVGQISMGKGHAPLKASARTAAAHYDETSYAVADVTAGEDEHGIWVSGKVRDSVTDQQLHDLRAAALSGDWRRIGGNLEMVAALAVNVPGFPIPRPSLSASGDGQESLIAAQVVRHEPDVDSIPAIVASADAVEDKLSAVVQARNTFKAIGVERARRSFK